MSFKPIDSRRDEFRKYLERSGVVDEITKVLIKLYNTPERPENAIEFIFENLGHTLLHKDQQEFLKKELEDSQNEIADLKRAIEKLEGERCKHIMNGDVINENDENELIADIKQPINDALEVTKQLSVDMHNILNEKNRQSTTESNIIQEDEVTTLHAKEEVIANNVNESIKKDESISSVPSTAQKNEEIKIEENEPVVDSSVGEVVSTEKKELSVEKSKSEDNSNKNDEKLQNVSVKESVENNEEVTSTTNVEVVVALDGNSEKSPKENVQSTTVTSTGSVDAGEQPVEESTNSEKIVEDNKDEAKKVDENK